MPTDSTTTSAEEQKMLAGELYFANDPHLIAKRDKALALCKKFNDAPDGSGDADILKELLGGAGKEVFIMKPFRCDYGCNTYIGDRVFMNFGTIILDTCKVTIGNDVLFGPNVCLFPATHPIDPYVRRNWGPEAGKPITIGNDVWIGGNVTILAGVTIGDGCTVGAGSVVTKSVEPFTVVAGNPARFIRRVERKEEGEKK